MNMSKEHGDKRRRGLHASDCAIYNAPAYEPETCSCGYADTPTGLRERANALETQAWEIERAELSGQERFMVVEPIQDGRPRASGPFTWDEAERLVREFPTGARYICDYGAPLP